MAVAVLWEPEEGLLCSCGISLLDKDFEVEWAWWKLINDTVCPKLHNELVTQVVHNSANRVFLSALYSSVHLFVSIIKCTPEPLTEMHPPWFESFCHTFWNPTLNFCQVLWGRRKDCCVLLLCCYHHTTPYNSTFGALFFWLSSKTRTESI